MNLEHLPEVRICFIGDSFVNGTGDPECLGWAGRICVNANKKGNRITYYNLGIRRNTSADIKSRWLQEVSCRLPKEYDGRIVFSFGVNDTTIENGKDEQPNAPTRVEFTESIENARIMVREAKQLYPILMIGSPPIAAQEQNQRIANLSKQFAIVCNELNVPFLDVFPILENSDIWMDEVRCNDGAHPKAAGYALLAEIVQNWDAWLNWFKC